MRLYALQMQAHRDRLRLAAEMRNRSAWNTAALTGAAFAGKLRGYDSYFSASDPRQSGPQTPEQLEAALHVLAAAWGASPEEP